MGLLTFLSWRNAMYGAAIMAAWLLWIVAYRLYFHPLRNVPGPRLAAVTRLYLLYYNAVQNGVLYLEIERLHKVYGKSQASRSCTIPRTEDDRQA